MCAQCTVLSEELCILESCLLRPIMRNSVLEELRVRRFADIHEEISCRAVWRWVLSQSYEDGLRKIVEYHLRKGVGLEKVRS